MSALAQPTGGGAASAAAASPTRSAASYPLPRPHSVASPLCAHCNAEGAANYCAGCSQSYCSKECQTMDWKKHKKHCKKVQAMRRAQRMPRQSEDGVAPGGGEGDGSAAAAAAGGSGAPTALTVDDEDEIENPCPVCLDNEDDATVDDDKAGMCGACGQSYCGACKAGGLAVRSPNCPTCRAPLVVSAEEHFKQFWKLEHDRSPGRHTPVAQHTLGNMYYTGHGVERNHVEAAKWFRKSAEAGYADAQWHLGIMYRDGEGVEHDPVEAANWYQKSAEAGDVMAQCTLGIMYRDGKGVEQDHVEAVKWVRKSAEAGHADAQCYLSAMYINGKVVTQDLSEALKWLQLAAVQGDENALEYLDAVQQHSTIPTPPPRTTVTTILLTSAKACKYNSKTGRVVEPPSPDMSRPGIAFVLLDGEAKSRMFKLMNLQLV
eukprot:gene13443-biopygen31112